MAPPGPPPYTLEQIQAMTSPDERLRARAELKSYIARMKKEKEERLAQESHRSNGYSMAGPQRGGYGYRGNTYGSYHPYQRPPPHSVQKFKNRSVTFNKAGSAAESSGTNGSTAGSPKGATKILPRQSSQQQTESKTLCAALTSTGVCSRHGCRYLHDPNKQALCKRWLYKDDCPKGDFCPLSHKSSPFGQSSL